MQSRFNHLLDTNYAPFPDELEQIRTLIQKPEDELRVLNEEISNQAKRDKLQSFVDGHRALLSPARRIPREIIAEVFLQCLPTIRLPACSIGEAPLLLTTVCRSWREIALTTPQLWRAIHFALPTPEAFLFLKEKFLNEQFIGLSLGRMERTELWLERARSVPLHVSFFLDHTALKLVTQELASIYSEFVDILSQHSARWKALYLKGLPREALSRLHSVKAVDAPLLQSLSLVNNSLEFTEDWQGTGDDYPLFNATATPSLRVLHLQYERVDPLALPVRWNQLTELNLRPFTSYDSVRNPIIVIHRLAQTCPSLRKCTLNLNVRDNTGFGAAHLQTQTWHHLLELSIFLSFDEIHGIENMI
ncbi:hypothetical protein MPER_07677 [Moniliophthora perniciosa FA553]|nr:hypothetical protein MPER_07677 [Moniliophthora perniciosa FA553]